jgi:hypothetical protein
MQVENYRRPDAELTPDCQKKFDQAKGKNPILQLSELYKI